MLVGTRERQAADNGPHRRMKAKEPNSLCAQALMLFTVTSVVCMVAVLLLHLRVLNVHLHLFIRRYGVVFLTGPLMLMTSEMLLFFYKMS